MTSRRTRSSWLLAPVILLASAAAYGQIADSAADVVANISVNYTETKAGDLHTS